MRGGSRQLAANLGERVSWCQTGEAPPLGLDQRSESDSNQIRIRSESASSPVPIAPAPIAARRFAKTPTQSHAIACNRMRSHAISCNLIPVEQVPRGQLPRALCAAARGGEILALLGVILQCSEAIGIQTERGPNRASACTAILPNRQLALPSCPIVSLHCHLLPNRQLALPSCPIILCRADRPHDRSHVPFTRPFTRPVHTPRSHAPFTRPVHSARGGAQRS